MKSIGTLGRLDGRRALVTGANGQLGKVFADTLAELGADLVLLDLDETDLNANRLILERRWGVEVEYFPCDLENQNQRNQFLKSIKLSNRELNILVNNAAFVGSTPLDGWNASFEKQSLETWRRAMEVNLTSIFHLCQGLYSAMKNSSGASVINITSIYGSYGPDWRMYEGTNMNNPAAYAASKGGLTQLTRWLATTMAPNVRVNAISPGGIYKQQDPSFVAKYEFRTPLARMATPEDLKGAMAFLATDLSQFVTGHILEVNGGWGVW